MPPVAFLNYGLLGLCGLIIWLFWRLFDREQRRPGAPRKTVVRFSWIFIALAGMLAATGLTLEVVRIVSDRTAEKGCESRVDGLRIEHQKTIDAIRAERQVRIDTVREELSALLSENARLTERVAARDFLLNRVGVEVGPLVSGIKTLPTSKQQQASVSVPAPLHAQPIIRMVSVNVRLPENEQLKQRTPAIEKLLREIAEREPMGPRPPTATTKSAS